MHRLLCLLSLLSFLTIGTADIPVYSLREAYALLVAGSNGYYNYRHQADVAHAYHLLLSKGMPTSHIVVMMYDDIAMNPSNPEPGHMKNLINGPNLYPGLNIDYRGNDVNIYTFHDVLTGKKDAVQGKGTGRVIESTKDDKVFLYYADHGAVGFVEMPSGPMLHRSFLHKSIREAIFSDMVVYIEACESGSMFVGIEEISNVFGLSASMANESSWATQCMNGTCYADEFSLNWIQDSEQYNLNQHHVENQFLDVRTSTIKSTVCQFGSSGLSENYVSEYQGAKPTGGKIDGDVRPVQTIGSKGEGIFSIPARETPLYYYQEKSTHGKTAEERKSAAETLEQILKKREIGRDYFNSLVGEVSYGLTRTVKTPLEALNCYESILMKMESQCIELSTTPYLNSMVSKFQQLAERLDCAEIRSRLETACSRRTMMKHVL